jgi:hypothetical protein
MTQKKKLFIDLLVVVSLILIAVPIIIGFNVRPLVSTAYFFIIPSIYLLIRRPKNLKRIFGGAFLIGTIFGFIFDFLAIYNNAWTEPIEQLVFKYKMLGIVPIDHMIWFFSWALIIIVFYEHFLEHDTSDDISHNYKYGAIPSIVATVIIIILFFATPDKIKIGYSYLFLGLCTLVPFLYLSIKKPVLFLNSLKLLLFSFFFFRFLK